MDQLQKLSDALSGVFLARAIFEDYCQVVSKIEGVDPKVIEKRILDKSNEHLQKFKDDTQTNNE